MEELSIRIAPDCKVRIFLGETQVGLVQRIKFEATAQEFIPQLEIVFPEEEVLAQMTRQTGVDIAKKVRDAFQGLSWAKVTFGS